MYRFGVKACTCTGSKHLGVHALSYSDGPIGRFDAADVLKHTAYWQRQDG